MRQIIGISMDKNIYGSYRFLSTESMKTSLYEYPQGYWCNGGGCNEMGCDYFWYILRKHSEPSWSAERRVTPNTIRLGGRVKFSTSTAGCVPL